RNLETFPNPNPERDYAISFEAPEFTCLCPMTGQPDFATIRIRYTPDEKCVELKSLKLYLWSFRDEGTFHEAVTNRIADDLIAALQFDFRSQCGGVMKSLMPRSVASAAMWRSVATCSASAPP